MKISVVIQQNVIQQKSSVLLGLFLLRINLTNSNLDYSKNWQKTLKSDVARSKCRSFRYFILCCIVCNFVCAFEMPVN